MAMRVPAECFYVRFGSFANFLWLQDTLAKWGGDCAEPHRPARPRSRHEQPHRKAARAEADRALADARRHGRWPTWPLSAPTCSSAKGPPTASSSTPATISACRPASTSSGRNGSPPAASAEEKIKIADHDGFLSGLARRSGPLVLRGRRRFPFRRHVEDAGGPIFGHGLGTVALGAIDGVPPRPQHHAHQPRRHGVAVPFRRVLPQHHQPALSRRDGAAVAGGGRHRAGAIGEAGGRQRGLARRDDRATHGGQLLAARVRTAARRQPHRPRRRRGLRQPPRPARGVLARRRRRRSTRSLPPRRPITSGSAISIASDGAGSIRSSSPSSARRRRTTASRWWSTC